MIMTSALHRSRARPHVLRPEDGLHPTPEVGAVAAREYSRARVRGWASPSRTVRGAMRAWVHANPSPHYQPDRLRTSQGFLGIKETTLSSPPPGPLPSTRWILEQQVRLVSAEIIARVPARVLLKVNGCRCRYCTAGRTPWPRTTGRGVRVIIRRHRPTRNLLLVPRSATVSIAVG
ncbi:hypothetical protein BC628DRAFT_1380549 [Trametes gibbosa]|nr:hypothetical protein BC628DRAFT_1380549 [Trametes gibbosa]